VDHLYASVFSIAYGEFVLILLFCDMGRGTGLATFSRALKNGFVCRFERKPVRGFLGVLCGLARYRFSRGVAWIS
jgi:hypothetical protein